MAAVNCDEESNKAFCGSMGVQGFPTLKIVKPSKKKGKPSVEDYNGQREAKDIIEQVKAAIPNNVKRITDKGLSAWLDTENSTSKAILFSDKGTTSAAIKVLAIEFIGKMNFAQIRNKEQSSVDMFGVTDYPTLVVLPGGTQEPVTYDGAITKDAMSSFLSQYSSGSSKTKAEKQKPMGKEPTKGSEGNEAKSKEASLSFSEASASHASSEASEEAAGATSIVLEDDSNPTESPDPKVTPENKPIVVPDRFPPIPALEQQETLQQLCLGERTTTCVLALLPVVEGEKAVLAQPATTALASLAELADKHVERKGNLFPFYSIPSENTGAALLRSALKLGDDKDLELIAVNARRGWVRRYDGAKYDFHSIENWVDNIRFGEGSKSVLPEELIIVAKDEPVVEDPKPAATDDEPAPVEAASAATEEDEPTTEAAEPEPVPTHGEL